MQGKARRGGLLVTFFLGSLATNHASRVPIPKMWRKKNEHRDVTWLPFIIFFHEQFHVKIVMLAQLRRREAPAGENGHLIQAHWGWDGQTSRKACPYGATGYIIRERPDRALEAGSNSIGGAGARSTR